MCTKQQARPRWMAKCVRETSVTTPVKMDEYTADLSAEGLDASDNIPSPHAMCSLANQSCSQLYDAIRPSCKHHPNYRG